MTATYKTSLGTFLVFVLGPLSVKMAAFNAHQGNCGVVSRCEDVKRVLDTAVCKTTAQIPLHLASLPLFAFGAVPDATRVDASKSVPY
jgi:hypothetical protein